MKITSIVGRIVRRIQTIWPAEREADYAEQIASRARLSPHGR